MKISKHLVLASLMGFLVSTAYTMNENDERDNHFQNPNVASSPESIDLGIQAPTGNTMSTRQQRQLLWIFLNSVRPVVEEHEIPLPAVVQKISGLVSAVPLGSADVSSSSR